MTYLGDYQQNATVHFLWSTNDSAGASVSRAGDSAAVGNIFIYKDNVSTTETNTGIVDTEDFDGMVGINAVSITTTDGFYATGADYAVVLQDERIDGQIVNAVLAHFSIQNRA